MSQKTEKIIQRQKLTPPKRYAVVLLNDHYTPMDFVVAVLTEIFALNHEKAVAVMLQIHHEGSSVCGVYTRDIAETKRQQVMQAADEAGHPLMCIVQEAQS